MPKEASKYSDSSVFSTPFSNPKLFKDILGSEEQFYKARNALAKKYNLKELLEQIKNAESIAKVKEQLEKELHAKIAQIEKDALKATLNWQKNQYEKASLEKRQLINEEALNQINKQREVAEYERELIKANSSLSTEEKRKALQENSQLLKQYSDQEQQIQKRKDQNEKQLNLKNVNELNNAKKRGFFNLNKWLKNQDAASRKEMFENAKKQNKKDQKEYEKAQKKLSDLQEKFGPKIKEKEERGEDTSWYTSRLRNAEQEVEAASANLSSSNQAVKLMTGINTAIKIASTAIKLGSNIGANVANYISKADEMITSTQSIVNASLQGTSKTFQEMLETVETNLQFSSIVKMDDVITSIKEASDQGITYNIEQRAFLDTVSDKIAHTFDAFDSNLTRLIRLQQSDSTAARLGMEASLTKLFNSTFNDSSYLSDVYDAVSEAIIDANSQLTKQESAAFEYTLQKWLGSLYSLGLSSDTITQIAQGINYLATGDVTNLASSSSLQTLMAMSASNAGLDFAEIMLEGLDAETTNKLMESMVLYLKDIAENSDSQVVKSAYGDIFNMSLSDLRAFSNMTASDISTIASLSNSYTNLVNETQSQLLQTVFRSSMSELMGNVYSNAMYGMGLDLAQNPGTWSYWKMLEYMGEWGIDIAIPSVSFAGFGLDLEASVTDLMRMGLGLSGAFALMGNIISGIFSGSSQGLSLSDWGDTEASTRGNSIGGLLSTMIGGTSSSTYIANNSSSDTVDSTLYSATDEASETSKITNKNTQPDEHSLDDFWEATVGEGATDYFVVQDAILQAVYYPTLQSIRVADIPLLNYMAGVFGNSSLLENESIRTKDIGISEVRNGNYLRVKDDALGSSISSGALQTYVRGGSLTAEISNLTQLGNMLKQNSNNTVTLSPNTQVTINEQTLVKAIVTALSGTDNNIKLKQFIDGSLSIDTSYAPTFKVKIDSNTTNSGLLSYNGLSRY